VKLEPTRGEYHLGRLLSLPTNIRIDWEDLPGTNAIPYLASSPVIKTKFLTLTPGPNVIKLSVAVIYKCSY
jgi:hypothetical protein